MTWTTPTTPSAGDTFAIAGRWTPQVANNLIYLHDLVALSVLNSSGVAVANGSVVVVSTAGDAVILTSTTVGDTRIVGIAQENIADGQSGYVVLLGRVNTLKVTGAVARQDPLQVSATAQYAQTGSAGAFAVALTTNPSGLGTVQALLTNDASLRAAPRVSAVYDTANVARLIPNATSKTIADGAATSLFEVACASGAVCGGMLAYLVRVFDGTDWQALSGIVTYAAVNKAGTLTLTITEAAGNQAKAVSAGTLTLAWTFVTGASKGTVKLQPTGSLTETSPYDVTYTVLPLIGAVTVL